MERPLVSCWGITRGEDDWRGCFGVVRRFLANLRGRREEEEPPVGEVEVCLCYW